jgi:hypothetical protein
LSRHTDSGCLGIAFVAVAVLTVIGVAAGLLSAPALIVYFLIANPTQALTEIAAGVAVLAADALLAVGLVAAATGRDRRTASRMLRRTAILLLVTTVTSVVSLLLAVHGNFTPTLHMSAIPEFVVAGVAAALLGYWRITDGRSSRPPAEQVEPVTVEHVRQVTEQARQSLHRVRTENDRLEHLLRHLEARLAGAQSEMEFAGLRQLHRESRTCADRVHEHYRSSDHILREITRAHRGIEVAVGGAPFHVGSLPDRPAYAAARSEMATTESRLRAEVNRGRSMVSTLNQGTEALKYRIRDDCGTRGAIWFDDLMARRDAARAAEGRY